MNKKTIEEIAQWVIDNRYSKSENDKVTDFEMYHTLIEAMSLNDTTKQTEPFICPCCGSDNTYKTEAMHCNRCAVTTEI